MCCSSHSPIRCVLDAVAAFREGVWVGWISVGFATESLIGLRSEAEKSGYTSTKVPNPAAHRQFGRRTQPA